MAAAVHPWSAAAVLAVGCALAPAVHATRAIGTLEFEPCTLAAVGMPVTVAAQCAVLAVPEDRARPDGRRIQLAVAFVPSQARHPQPDPVFMLAGGPGQSARESYPAVAMAFRGVLRDRHVVLVDQRGTGGSNPLACREADDQEVAGEGDAIDREAAQAMARRCLAGLEADARFYTTSDAVLDLEDVRKAIGAGQVNLVGISYGTRVAQEYLRRYPARTRTVVLDGVVPPPLVLGAEHARNLDAALEAQFARCKADAQCARRFGSPMDRLDELLADLRARPRSVTYRDPLTWELRTGTLTAATVAGVARLYAYVPGLAAMLPVSLAEAAAGRPEVLMAQASMIESLVGEQVAHGMQLSVICSEDADLLGRDPADAGTLLGTALVDLLDAQCAVWPRGRRPADFHEPVRSDAPVLLLSGEFDPVTPPAYGEQVLATFPNGRHLVARGHGHNVMVAGCMPRLMTRFIETKDAQGLDARCLDQLIYTPPFTGAYGWEP
ncbi:MAG: alpha/beta hydrolase [Steroidobacteraceae bacterium]